MGPSPWVMASVCILGTLLYSYSPLPSEFILGLVTGIVGCFLLPQLLGSNQLYSLEHVALNLKYDSTWCNMGYWDVRETLSPFM
jgi:hypothetical protein